MVPSRISYILRPTMFKRFRAYLALMVRFVFQFPCMGVGHAAGIAGASGIRLRPAFCGIMFADITAAAFTGTLTILIDPAPIVILAGVIAYCAAEVANTVYKHAGLK